MSSQLAEAMENNVILVYQVSLSFALYRIGTAFCIMIGGRKTIDLSASSRVGPSYSIRLYTY